MKKRTESDLVKAVLDYCRLKGWLAVRQNPMHRVNPKPVCYWYAWDIDWLKKCDAVLRLDGESTGADREVLLAGELNPPVFYTVDALLKAEWHE